MIFQSLLFFALLIEVTGRYLSEAKDAEVAAPKYRDIFDEEVEAAGGSYGDTPKLLGSMPEDLDMPEVAEEQPRQHPQPKLQPVDESSVVITDPDPQVEETHEDVENKDSLKGIQTHPDCVPRDLIEDKAYRTSEESVAKEVVEDSLSPLNQNVETSTFSNVTDPNMIEEPFKKVYVRPLCDD